MFKYGLVQEADLAMTWNGGWTWKIVKNIKKINGFF